MASWNVMPATMVLLLTVVAVLLHVSEVGASSGYGSSSPPPTEKNCPPKAPPPPATNTKSPPPPTKKNCPPPPNAKSPPPPSTQTPPSGTPPVDSPREQASAPGSAPPPPPGGSSGDDDDNSPGTSIPSPPSTPTPVLDKPDCKKNGSMCGDPRITGGDGVVFYFHGHKDQDFCLVSDSDLHINAHFIGKRPDGRHRDFTWVQALGFVFGDHALTIAAKKVGVWDPAVDQLELAHNGVPFALDAASWSSPDGALTLIRIATANAVDLVIREKMSVALTVVPVGKEENRVHRYGVSSDDCFAHFDMQFRFHNLSSSVNGVLGQTYQPGFVNPVQRGVAMPVMGGADRFSSSSLLATDCRVSQYTAQAIAEGSALPSFMTMCGSGALPKGVPGGLTCRR